MTYPDPQTTPAPADATSTDPTAAAPTDPTTASAPSTTSSRPAENSTVSYELEDGTAGRGLVVGYVDADEGRDEGVLVVPLPDAIVVPVDAVKD